MYVCMYVYVIALVDDPKVYVETAVRGGERVYAITSVSNYAITLCSLPVSD